MRERKRRRERGAVEPKTTLYQPGAFQQAPTLKGSRQKTWKRGPSHVTAASRGLEVVSERGQACQSQHNSVGERSGRLGPKTTLVNGMRRDPTLSLPLENPSQTKRVSGADEMVLGWFGFVPLGKVALGGRGSAERRSHRECPGHRLEDALPAQRQPSEGAAALALSKLLF